MARKDAHTAILHSYYRPPADYTMEIISNSVADKCELCYTLLSNGGNLGRSIIIDNETIIALQRNLENFLNHFAELKSWADDVESSDINSQETSLLLSFENLGTGLFINLIPDHIKEAIRDLSPGSLNIISDIDWIPWELLNDGKEYLGNKMFIIRSPYHGRINKLEALDDWDIINNNCRIVHVIGPLVAQNDKIRYLFECFSKSCGHSVQSIENRNLAFLFDNAKNPDILHFTCHGSLEPQVHLKICEEENYLVNLHTDAIKSKHFEVENCKLVFANACSSAGNRVSIGKFLGFGISFYDRGARIFIGTSASIPSGFAFKFSDYFYQELSKGIDVAESFAKAKNKFSNAESIFNLLYVFYSNPCDCLTPELVSSLKIPSIQSNVAAV